MLFKTVEIILQETSNLCRMSGTWWVVHDEWYMMSGTWWGLKWFPWSFVCNQECFLHFFTLKFSFKNDVRVFRTITSSSLEKDNIFIIIDEWKVSRVSMWIEHVPLSIAGHLKQGDYNFLIQDKKGFAASPQLSTEMLWGFF